MVLFLTGFINKYHARGNTCVFLQQLKHHLIQLVAKPVWGSVFFA
jgi:hypothetical protein